MNKQKIRTLFQGKYYEESSCSCNTCKQMCTNVCWPTPDETVKLIKAGYGPKLMIDIWERFSVEEMMESRYPVTKLDKVKAIVPLHRNQKCVFFTKKGLCNLHDTGLKPFEARIANCKKRVAEVYIRDQLVDLWATEDGQKLVVEWYERYGDPSVGGLDRNQA